ncbi:class I SAM-dependent methyltransferase [Micromonospora auratinigra]|uniref:Methyltransferase domain-containing protein n=1 Tax=Micromonospora auratinigra TaxID=261654 RepID=A0A1A8ZHI1_9ACTN|nr:class I SAM-dependent methyltransferase [Micromonospora auratinigra]SBT43288.1 Methyltransferase domain-containing protein [Micromonospora auratinigra]
MTTTDLPTDRLSAPPRVAGGGLRGATRRLRSALHTASGLEVLSALPFLAGPLARLERRPLLHGLVLSAFGLRRPIFVDFPVHPEPRFGYGRPDHPGLTALLERRRDAYADTLRRFLVHTDRLAAVPLRGDLDSGAPYWVNGWLPPLDALALYGFLTEHDPRRYVEIGSGNSTKFARRAVRDHGLRTTITSIDPAPRASVDVLCDEVVRAPLERADLSLFDTLEAGDVIFFDGSHRSFMGSDVTVFFFEVLPRLRPGVLVQVHDIMLPRDYPPQWRHRHYNEQYLLAAFLLAAPERWQVELPNAFVAGDPELRALADPLWRRIGLTEQFLPASFWLRPGTP